MSLLSSFTTVLRLTFPDAKLPLEKASTEYSQLEEFCRAIEDHPTYTCGKDHIFRDAEIGRPNCVVIVVASRTEKRFSMNIVAEAIPAVQQLLPLLECPPQINHINFSSPFATGLAFAQFPNSVIELISFTLPHSTSETIESVSKKVTGIYEALEFASASDDELGDMIDIFEGWSITKPGMPKVYNLQIKWRDVESQSRFKDKEAPNRYSSDHFQSLEGDDVWQRQMNKAMLELPGGSIESSSISFRVRHWYPN